VNRKGTDEAIPAVWLVAGLAWLAAALASVGLGAPSLWIDETHSWEFSCLPSAWLVILNAAARDAYPPLYFLLLHFWMMLGTGEAWLRTLSVLFHVAAVPVAFLVGARLVSRPAGLLAAALLAVSPFHLAFAREVRMYSMVELLSLLSVWGLLKWVQDGSRAGWRVFVLAGIALIYTQFMGALLLLAEALFLFGERKRPGVWAGTRKWILATVLCFLPWSPFFLKAALVTRGYGVDASIPELAYYFLGVTGAGFGAARWVLSVSMALLAVLVWAGYEALPRGSARRLLAWWAFLPPVLEMVSGLLGKSVFGERTLIGSTPALLILVASAVSSFPRGRAVLSSACLGALAGFGFAHLQGYILPTAPHNREAVALVMAHARSGDVILHSSTVTYHPVHEYYLPLSATRMGDYMLEPPAAFRGGRLGNMFREAWRRARASLDPRGVLKTGADPHRISEDAFTGIKFRRVWYFRETPVGLRRLWLIVPANFYRAGDPRFRDVPMSVHRQLDRELSRAGQWEFPGLSVELYERM